MCTAAKTKLRRSRVHFGESRVSPQDVGAVVRDLAGLSVSGVFFTCPLTGAALTKSEREVHIKEAIFMVCVCNVYRVLILNSRPADDNDNDEPDDPMMLCTGDG